MLHGGVDECETRLGGSALNENKIKFFSLLVSIKYYVGNNWRISHKGQVKLAIRPVIE